MHLHAVTIDFLVYNYYNYNYTKRLVHIEAMLWSIMCRCFCKCNNNYNDYACMLLL